MQGAPYHTAKRVKNYFEQKDVQVMAYYWRECPLRTDYNCDRFVGQNWTRMEENNARTLKTVSEVLWSPLRRRNQRERIQHFILSVPRVIFAESSNVSNIFTSVTVLCTIVLLLCTSKHVLLLCLQI